MLLLISFVICHINCLSYESAMEFSTSRDEKTEKLHGVALMTLVIATENTLVKNVNQRYLKCLISLHK